MKKMSLFIAVSMILGTLGCGNGGGNNGSSVAAVPQGSCGSYGIASQYCTPYNSSGYGVYGTTGYSSNCGVSSGYGYGSTYGYGLQQPCYPSGVGYGCGAGFQPVAFSYGGQLNCVAVSYISGLGATPYYASNYAWSGGSVGWGPLMFCNPAFGSNQCGYTGTTCHPAANGSLHGVCY